MELDGLLAESILGALVMITDSEDIMLMLCANQVRGGGGGHSHTNVLPTRVHQSLNWSLKWRIATPKRRQTCIYNIALNGVF